MEYLIIVILSAAVLFLAARLLLIKKQLKSVSEQLDDYNGKLVSVELTGDELEGIVLKINSMIDDISKIKSDADKNSAALKETIADISHDMRTPLTSVIGYLQLALKDCTDSEQRKNINIALERAVYCSKLIDEFFELSVIDSKGCTANLENVDVNELLCELILANYPNFEAKGITPFFEDTGKPVVALADRKMLTRIIQNLISNSIKYAVGKVEFAVYSADMIEISVSNHTTEKFIDTARIFDKFFQTSKSRTSGGAGIGLYICKQFAEAMGGSIEAIFKGEMLTFVLKLQPNF